MLTSESKVGCGPIEKLAQIRNTCTQDRLWPVEWINERMAGRGSEQRRLNHGGCSHPGWLHFSPIQIRFELSSRLDHPSVVEAAWKIAKLKSMEANKFAVTGCDPRKLSSKKRAKPKYHLRKQQEPSRSFTSIIFDLHVSFSRACDGTSVPKWMTSIFNLFGNLFVHGRLTVCHNECYIFVIYFCTAKTLFHVLLARLDSSVSQYLE